MSVYLLRLVIAVVVCALIFALIPPVINFMGIGANGDVLQIIRICIIGIAIFYVGWGKYPPNA